ncbi:hypothetical protein DFQ26_007779 [Actinomortierella ambigua]|nr:hypothetical protein DFQ26_007779 [Actinomortierella ambigua]
MTMTATTPPITEDVLVFPPPAVVPGSSGENLAVGGLQWDLSALRLDTTSLLGRRMRTRTMMTPITPVTPTYSNKDKISSVSAHTTSSVSDAGDQNDHNIGTKMGRSYSSSSKTHAQLRALTIPAVYHSGHRHSRSVDGIKTPVSAVSTVDDALPHSILPSKALSEKAEAGVVVALSDMKSCLQRPAASTFESTTPVSPTFTEPAAMVRLPSSPKKCALPSLSALQREDKAPIASPTVTVTFEAVSYAVHEDAPASQII